MFYSLFSAIFIDTLKRNAMKNVYLILILSCSLLGLTAQNEGVSIDFSLIENLDEANKLVIDLKAKTPENVVILEKDYIVSSERVKAINKRFTEQENTEGIIITVSHNGLKDFSEEWVKLIKVLINDPNVLKLREYEEENFQMLVTDQFDWKSLEKVALKAKWPISLSE